MSKLLKCPVCKKTKPVRNDAEVCSSNCRVKRWRENQKKKLKCHECGNELTREEIEYLEDICCDCESKTDWYGEGK